MRVRMERSGGRKTQQAGSNPGLLRVEELMEPTSRPRDLSLTKQPDTLADGAGNGEGSPAPLLEKAGSFGLLTKQSVLEEGWTRLGWGLVPTGLPPCL